MAVKTKGFTRRRASPITGNMPPHDSTARRQSTAPDVYRDFMTDSFSLVEGVRGDHRGTPRERHQRKVARWAVGQLLIYAKQICKNTKARPGTTCGFFWPFGA